MLSSLSIIGLGKLGAPMTACFAARGFTVHAVDFNPQNSLRPPTVDEPTKTVRVPGQRLDDALAELDVSNPRHLRKIVKETSRTISPVNEGRGSDRGGEIIP
jgi:3-hydroxyisobutyrate dehydrogenase-like beta-hydroxyacid dehydrogenase